MKKIYAAILKVTSPLVKLTGKIHVPFSRKRVTGAHYYKIRDQILPGTVLLTKTDGEFSNLINPEHLKHAMIYCGDVFGTGVLYVLEATKKGVHFTDLVTALVTKDRVVGCGPVFLSDQDRTLLPQMAKGFVGIKYDWGFTDGDETMYCFETVAKVYEKLGHLIEWDMKEVVKGFEIYSYSTFAESKHFVTLFDTDEI
ncbi:MAG: hypothetical protein KAG61_12380 [Bacteriovoracaceae bacterium]|nr:hypothetical protein [Bacteriovoracaceae bacterium]